MSADEPSVGPGLAARLGSRLDALLDVVVRHVRPKLVLASTATAVLAMGFVSRPPGPASGRTISREAAAPSLEARVQQREPSRVFRGVQDAGRRALDHAVTFPTLVRAPSRIPFADFTGPAHETNPPLGFGLLVSTERDVLTHVSALGGTPDPVVQLPDGTLMRGRATVHDPDTGLVLVRLAGSFAAAVPGFAEERALPGELAVAAARVNGGDFVAPVFVASVDANAYTLTAASGVIFPGTPIFNVAGEALAIAAGSTATGVAYSVTQALSRLADLAAAGHGLPAYIGVALQALSPELQERLGQGAVVVSDVREGGPAADAGVQPGDVLLRVGSAEPTTTEGALRAISRLTPGAPMPVLVRRGREERELVVTAQPALVLSTAPSPVRKVPTDAPTAGSSFDLEALAGAGVSPQAYVLALERQPVSASQPLRTLQRRRRPPWLVYLQEGERRFYAVIGAGA